MEEHRGDGAGFSSGFLHGENGWTQRGKGRASLRGCSGDGKLGGLGRAGRGLGSWTEMTQGRRTSMPPRRDSDFRRQAVGS